MTPLSEEVLANLGFRSKVVTRRDWFSDGDKRIFWENEKGNFSITQNNQGSWDVYFGLDFTPNRIKNNLLYVEELNDLYKMLTGQTLKSELNFDTALALQDIDPERKEDIINKCLVAIAKPLLWTYVSLGLQDGIVSGIANDATGDLFELSFKRVATGKEVNMKFFDKGPSFTLDDMRRALEHGYMLGWDKPPMETNEERNNRMNKFFKTQFNIDL